MSDGGQRLLDVIDDPNALESFLGGLTSDSELLPSAESVDNVVASLARSLEADYEVDSPNDTLFDTLESSSNNLTDISQSYVPSDTDFDNVNMSNVGSQQNYSHSMGSMSNGEITHQVIQHQQIMHSSLSSVVTSGVEQYLMSNNQSGNDGGNGSGSTTTSIQPFDSNCDSSSVATTNSQFFQQQQLQMNQNQIMIQNSNGNSTYVYNQDLLQSQTMINQTQQIASLSSSTVSQHSNDSSMNQSISVSIPNNQNNSGQVMSQQDQIQVISQGQQTSTSSLSSINLNASSNNSVTSTTVNELNSSNSVNITNNSSITSTAPMQQQYISSAAHQTTLNQLVSSGQVSLANVGGTQIIATSTGNIVTGQGQANILQQIQSAAAGQSFITVDQPTTALIAGPTAFGATNLALVTTGGTPTYAVVPTGTQFLSNAIMTQPQAIQTLTKGPNGTYFQTTGGTQLVATSNVSQIQNVNVTVANNSNTNKPKQPPQLLPKPQSGSGNSSGTPTSASGSSGTDSISSTVITSTNCSTGGGTTVTTTDRMVTQMFQQQQTAQIQGISNQVVVTSVGNTGTLTIPQQPTFTIGTAGGIGQVVMSQNPSSQTQLTGTIVVNQYGQPMLVPTASTGQGGLQFIVRQQPQPQVLTLQTQGGATTIGAQAGGGKPVVRYVSQVPQVAQSGGYGLQQIQTANGPAWVAIRYPTSTTTLATSAGQFNHIQTETLQTANMVSAQIGTPQQVQVQVPPQPQPQSVQPQPPQQPQVPQPLPSQPITSPAVSKCKAQTKHQAARDTTPDSSSGPPPAKKSKPKSKGNKKKVILDLEQLLKKSGIMDEDLEDDSFDFSFGDTPQNGFDSPVVNQPTFVQSQAAPQIQQSPIQHPAVNTSGKSKGSPQKKSNAKGSKKRKTPEKKRSPTPPPPPPPPPPTPKSGKGSRKKGGNQKAEIKTDNSRSSNKGPPKKLSSLDDVSAIINAVARCSPSPPSSPSPVQVHIPASLAPSSPAIASSIKPSTPTTPIQVPISTPNPSPTITPVTGSPHNGISSVPGQPGTTRIVQTIQLTPQNQQLLRNIQTQISRLLSLPKRNDTEQTALQKLIVLQQQVIATGIPVPNPSHLNNLAQNVSSNISATVLPASTFTTPAVPTINGIVSTTGDSLVSSSSTPAISNVTNVPQISTPAPNQSNNVLNTRCPPKVSPSSTKVTATKSAPPPLPPIETSASDTNNANGMGNFIQTPTGVVKVGVPNASSESNIGTPEENKENSTGSSNLVVASSTFACGTNTTNALGQHHLQSFPPTFRSAIDDKKAEEHRLANHKAEEEKRARWKKEEFEMLLKRDQQCVTQPDYEIPFCSKRDAVERLMKYHILRDRNDMNFEEFDNEFGEKSSLLLDKFNGMVAKHRSLLLKESMREVGCAERVMLERMFVSEEKLKLEQDRLLVNQGELLELPHPPESWIPKIQEMVDKEMKEMEVDSYVNMQVQSAIDSIIGFGNDSTNILPDDGEIKVEYDAFGVPINNSGDNGMNTSSADIDEAVRSILS